MKDLIVLVADKNMEFTLRGVLQRIPRVEHITELDFDIFPYPGHDPGIYNYSHVFLKGLTQSYTYCMAILDHEGSGQNDLRREEIETNIEQNLADNGWDNSSCAIAISPELENWIWVNSARLHEAIAWNQGENIYNWLIDYGWMAEGDSKPLRPKEALEAAMRLSKTPRSSAIYYEISSRASYGECIDPAFEKFIETIRRWFGYKKIPGFMNS